MLKNLKMAKKLQAKLGEILAAIPLSANHWTLLSIPAALLGLYFAYLSLPLHSLAMFLLAVAIDMLDGAVARAKKQVSAFGAYLDGITDRIVEFLLLVSFLFYSLPDFLLPAPILLILILFFGSCMTSFSVAYADHRKVADAKKLSKVPGILPRAERLILLLFALALIPYSPDGASFVIFAAALLSFLTFCQRVWHFAK
ncbi:MAG: CDP-alcohol phosphatidyltransferase family protein [Candidatus Micrarchaeota archaeon]|nr:CDP-alcohol phosphatidyltransferase family protein [Candidatus Micrarchaeota archaeon]